jgi:hypothetical protein
MSLEELVSSKKRIRGGYAQRRTNVHPKSGKNGGAVDW